jgi:hypothetical protein
VKHIHPHSTTVIFFLCPLLPLLHGQTFFPTLTATALVLWQWGRRALPLAL